MSADTILAAFVSPHAPLWVLLLIVAMGSMQAIAQHFITATLFSTPPVQRWFKATHRLFGTLYIALGLGVAEDAARKL